MTQERVIKVQADYRDSGLIERIAANFRRFWVDLKWMNILPMKRILIITSIIQEKLNFYYPFLGH